jgi:hypothetical protein
MDRSRAHESDPAGRRSRTRAASWLLGFALPATILIAVPAAGRAGALPATLAGARAALVNPTTPGALTAYTTLVSAGFEWRIDGDDNANCAVAVEYRRLGGAWKPAQPLLRVEHGIWTHGEDPGNLLAGSIFFLQPGTRYEARLTLSDPDGGADQRIVAFTTRTLAHGPALRVLYVVPGSGGGSGSQDDPLRGLAAADSVARPGDVILVQPGFYHGRFTVTHDGTATQPIVYRGTSQASVTLDGDGGTDSSSHCISLNGRRYVSVEDMSLINCLRPLIADSTVGVAVRGCFIRPVNVLVGTHGIRAAYSQDLLIANNTLQMPGQWTAIGRTGSYGTGGYGILVEGTGHVICHNTIVEAWDAISIPVTGTAVPACTTSNVDIYENYVDRASDDGVQADATQQNVRIFRNRLLNTGSAVSFQPCFGGPGYILFNEIYNNRIEPYKFHQEVFYGWTQETSGFLAYHNTSICSRQGWYESGTWRHGTLNDNLIIGGRPGTYTLSMNYSYAGARFDYDGYDRVNGFGQLVWFKPSAYDNLPAFYAGTGNEQHGIEVTTGAFVNAPLPHDPNWNPADGYGAAYGPADFDLRLAPGSAAVDAGRVLANVDDGFGGSAPDLGCYESGTAPPLYGPRTASLGALATADTSQGGVPLTVHFGGAATNAIGREVGYHWSFSDGADTSDDQNPIHTFARSGNFAATLTVMDDDGATASAIVVVHVGAATTVTGADPIPAAPRCSPNPFGSRTTIRFALTARAPARLAVYDARGARVRTLLDGVQPAGARALEWDGRADDGREAPPGLYFVELEAGGRTFSRRVTRLM